RVLFRSELASGERRASDAEADRAVRPVRRLDAVGLDAVRIREFRDSLYARLSEGLGCGEPQEQVRRPRPAVRRADSRCGRRGRPWWARRRPRRPECGGHSRRVSEDARADDARDDAAGARAIPQRRRHDHHRRHGDLARLRAWAADREPSRGALAGPARPRSDRRGVLRAGLDPAGRGQQQRPGGGGSAEQARCVLRQQPGVPAQAGRGAARDEGGGLVRLTVAAQERLGVGTELSRGRRGGSRVEVREGKGVSVRTRDHLPRAAARGFQVLVQWDLRADGAGAGGGAVGLPQARGSVTGETGRARERPPCFALVCAAATGGGRGFTRPISCWCTLGPKMTVAACYAATARRITYRRFSGYSSKYWVFKSLSFWSHEAAVLCSKNLL